MSERGVVAIDRGIFDHEIFAAEPFTEREAWMWLIAEAAWKPRTRRIGNMVVELARGQLAGSIRFMAERWNWSKSKVARFLDRLEHGDMISAASGTGINVITIRNYNTYQRVSLPDETNSGTETGTAAGQQRDKREDIKNIKYTEEANASSVLVDAPNDRQSDDWPTDYRDKFWAKYPNKVGKHDALSKLDRVRKARGVPWAVLWGGLERYVGKTDDRPWCNPATWIHQQRWTDEPAIRGENGPNRQTGGAGFGAGKGFSALALERARAAGLHD